MRKNLKLFCVERNISRKQLCTDLGYKALPYVSQVVNGHVNASRKMMERFKEVYNIKSMDEVYEIFKDE